MKTVMFSQEGSKSLTLKELADVGRTLFLGEDVPVPRNSEINNALYAAIILKRLIGLEQFSQQPSLQEQVIKTSEDIQSVLSKYTGSEAKDVDTHDLELLLNVINELPKLATIKDNTFEEKSILYSNLVAQSIAILKNSIPALNNGHKKHNSDKPQNLTPRPH